MPSITSNRTSGTIAFGPNRSTGGNYGGFFDPAEARLAVVRPKQIGGLERAETFELIETHSHHDFSDGRARVTGQRHVGQVLTPFDSATSKADVW